MGAFGININKYLPVGSRIIPPDVSFINHLKLFHNYFNHKQGK